MYLCNKRRLQNIFMYASLALYITCITGYVFLLYLTNIQESQEEMIMQRIDLRATSGDILNYSKMTTLAHSSNNDSYSKPPGRHACANIRIMTPIKQIQCKNWAVVITTSKPTDSVRLILSDSKWCVAIVADIDSQPKDIYISDLGYSGERLVFLGPEEQEHLYPELSKAIPWQHYGRKNVGYIFAIQNGAELIWDFDDTNQGLFNINIIHNQRNIRVLKRCKGSYKLFNPYPYFGADESYIWPRGFPLQFVRDAATMPGLCTTIIPVNTIGVIQSTANIEPDVDAIFRLMRPRSLTFEATNTFPFISVPRFSYCPFNARATLWTKSSFLYMALPTSVHSSVSDIWRSYIAQFFFHKHKTNLLFSSPYVLQNISTNHVADSDAEIDMHRKVDTLVDFLHTYRSQLNITLKHLYEELHNRGFVGPIDINFIQVWIKIYQQAYEYM